MPQTKSPWKRVLGWFSFRPFQSSNRRLGAALLESDAEINLVGMRLSLWRKTWSWSKPGTGLTRWTLQWVAWEPWGRSDGVEGGEGRRGPRGRWCSAVTPEDMTCLSIWPGPVRMAPAVYTMFWVFSLEHPLLAASVRDDSALINGNSKWQWLSNREEQI